MDYKQHIIEMTIETFAFKKLLKSYVKIEMVF